MFDPDGALSRAFLLERGFCCGNLCRNCPYDYVNVPPERAARAHRLRAAQRARSAPKRGASGIADGRSSQGAAD